MSIENPAHSSPGAAAPHESAADNTNEAGPTNTGADPAARARRTTRIVVLALLAATALAFATSLRAGFIWDDVLLISNNRFLVGPGALRRALTHAFWDVETAAAGLPPANYYRPAVTVTLVAMRALFGIAPLPYHALVIALHLSACALAARFLRRFVGDDPLALGLGVGLFALHASRAESVSWIVGMTDVLMALPAIAALTLATRPLRGDPAPPSPSRGVLCALLVVLALSAKETALVLPAALLAVCWLTWPAGPERRRALWTYGTSSLLAVLAYLALRAALLPIGGRTWSPALVRHAALVLESLGRYVGITAWPWPLTFIRTTLELDASHQIRIVPFWTLLGAAAIFVSAWVLRHGRNAPRATLGLLLALFFIAPVLNVRWMGTLNLVADRFLYMPLLGLGLCLAAAAQALAPSARRALAIAGVGLALTHGSSLALRGLEFRDEATLWGIENTMHPGVPLVMTSLARGELARGRHGRAFILLRDAFARIARYDLESHLAAEMYRALDVALLVVPDDDRTSLESALAFARALRDPHAPVAEARVLGYAFRLNKRGLDAWLRAESPRFRITEATVLSRLLRHDEARAAAAQGANECVRHCFDLYLNAALVHARARDWDAASRYAARARALDPDQPAVRALIHQLALARAHEADAARASTPAERDIVLAEIDLFLASPESARARLASLARSPRVELLRARAALLEYRFAEAAAILGPLRAGAPPTAAPLFAQLAELEARQRQRIEGLESDLAGR